MLQLQGVWVPVAAGVGASSRCCGVLPRFSSALVAAGTVQRGCFNAPAWCSVAPAGRRRSQLLAKHSAAVSEPILGGMLLLLLLW